MLLLQLPMSDMQWFPVRVTYSRELVLKTYLDEKQIENFIPMHYEYVVKHGQRVRKLVPAIHNLVFIHATRECVDEVKQKLSDTVPVRYIMNPETRRPIVVPDKQMHSFLLVAGNYDKAIVYLMPEELHLLKGAKVRITGGVFEGAIGEFVRIRHDRRVVVNVEGVMAVATAFVHPSLVEEIK